MKLKHLILTALFLIFSYLFVSFLQWDMEWFTKLGSWTRGDRFFLLMLTLLYDLILVCVYLANIKV
jgi:hypothetical protein